MHGPLALSHLPLSLLLLVPLFLSSSVNAHGIVHEITIGGRRHGGNQPNQGFRAPGPSVIRQVQDMNPVKGSFNPAVICGPNASRGTLVAEAYPGEEVLFNWGGWPHNTGPVLTYMASCGQVSCDQFDAAGARWFKISQVGKKQGQYEWHQADIQRGAPGRAVIPPNLAPGNYLIRHEIIALHIGGSPGGAEFYPSCAQLRVGGQGTGYPAENELVSFPGAYWDDHPGIFVPNIFENGLQYQFPGPPVAQLAGGAPAPQQPQQPQQPRPQQPQQPQQPQKPQEPVVGPINAAPIPTNPPANNNPAPTSPAPPAATPTKALRRCKQRPRKQKRSVKFVTSASQPSANSNSRTQPHYIEPVAIARSQPEPHYIEPVAISKRDVDEEKQEVVVKPVAVPVGRRHHGRMRRLSHSH